MGNGETGANTANGIVGQNSFVLIRSDAFITKLSLLAYSRRVNDSYSSWNVLSYSGTLYWNYWIIPVHSKHVDRLWVSMANTFLSKWNTSFFVFYSMHLCQIFPPRKSIYSLYLLGGIWLTWMLFWQLKQHLNAHYTSFTSSHWRVPCQAGTFFSQSFRSFCSTTLRFLTARPIPEKPLHQLRNIKHAASFTVIVRLLWYIVFMPGDLCYCSSWVISAGSFLCFDLSLL